ncbi:MAG: putative molybdenum carrier protein [Thermodesulfobacteriota bacterium]|nr:putative molybdenum carrier protein [Thermodesulfobacteriota bacterium]
MVNKIISGGQTGADRAALDVAIKLGISHGGWIPKGRLTENGMLDNKYHLKEMETANYNKRTEQNVIDSDGTLIISHGKLTGGSDYTRDMVLGHGRPWLHIDLNKTESFQAAKQIKSWLADHDIEVLNVAGPRANKDTAIYQATVDILETAFCRDDFSI